MTDEMDAAAQALRSILPSPYRLSDSAGDRPGVAYRGSGGSARFAVLDDLNRKACEVVITYEAARDDRVTHDALYRADLPGKLRQAIADGGTVWVLSNGVEVRAGSARARRTCSWATGTVARHARREGMMADDSSMRDVFDRTHAAFRQREEERGLIRATLEPILGTLASAEAKLCELNTFGAEERCRVARARLELLRALRSVERAANTLTEGNHRAAQSFVDHHAR